jgi:hypothetical protein
MLRRARVEGRPDCPGGLRTLVFEPVVGGGSSVECGVRHTAIVGRRARARRDSRHGWRLRRRNGEWKSRGGLEATENRGVAVGDASGAAGAVDGTGMAGAQPGLPAVEDRLRHGDRLSGNRRQTAWPLRTTAGGRGAGDRPRQHTAGAVGTRHDRPLLGGRRWTAMSLPADVQTLTGVSCAAADRCMAVGLDGQGHGTIATTPASSDT